MPEPGRRGICRKSWLRPLEPVRDLHIARVALPWPSGGGAWHSACLAGRSSRALPHGGHDKATRRAGSVCPHPCVITRSWTDVHSLLLPWPARKQLPARVTRRHGTGSRLARIHARPSASARHFDAWLPTRRVILPDSLLSRGAMLLAAAGCVLAMPAMAKSSPGFDGPL